MTSPEPVHPIPPRTLMIACVATAAAAGLLLAILVTITITTERSAFSMALVALIVLTVAASAFGLGAMVSRNFLAFLIFAERAGGRAKGVDDTVKQFARLLPSSEPDDDGDSDARIRPIRRLGTGS